MGGCRCTFRECSNSTASQPGMHFFHFPIRDWPRVEKWAAYADKLEFKELPLSKLKNKVVCEDHFRNRMFMNYLKESLTKTAIPTLEVMEDGSVWDMETNEIGPREEWPEAEMSGGGRTPRLVPVGDDSSRMEIQFLDGVESGEDEPNSMVKPMRSGKPVILNKVNIGSLSKVKVDQLPGPKPGAVLRKVVVKRKKSVEIIPEESPQKIKILSIQRMASKSTPQATPVEEPEVDALKEVPSVATPSSSTDDPVGETPAPVLQVVAPPPAVQAVTILDPNITKMLQDSANEIAELKKLLVEALNRPPPEPKVVRVEVPTPIAIPTPAQERPTSPIPEKGPHMNKVQLFNGVKRYLNPTMVALLRCELFGGSPERQWKPDERTLAVELLGLGDKVYDHFCDEFRFRLPPKKEAQKWKEQNELDDDDAS